MSSIQSQNNTYTDNFLGSGRKLSHRPSIAAETESWFSFPREVEGNSYRLNWSLVEDGVTSAGKAYRNPRTQVLMNHLGLKTSDTGLKVNLKSAGAFEVKEAGDAISHDKFQQLLDDSQCQLSSSHTIFVEDGAVGTSLGNRLGVRVISNSPDFMLAARNLMVTFTNFKLYKLQKLT